MVEAMQLKLETPYQSQEFVELLHENEQLKLENSRLQQEVNDMRRNYAEQERRLTMAYCKMHRIRESRSSSGSSGVVLFVICTFVAVFLLFFYGWGFFDSTSSSSYYDNDSPVVEKRR